MSKTVDEVSSLDEYVELHSNEIKTYVESWNAWYAEQAERWGWNGVQSTSKEA